MSVSHILGNWNIDKGGSRCSKCHLLCNCISILGKLDRIQVTRFFGSLRIGAPGTQSPIPE